MADNRDLHKQVDDIKAEYKQKEDNLEWKYKYRINKLERENGYLHNVIYKFRETIHKFIEWICVNFNMGAGDTLWELVIANGLKLKMVLFWMSVRVAFLWAGKLAKLPSIPEAQQQST